MNVLVMGVAILAAGKPAPAAPPAAAPVVLELFTSQGCSSCPPADALLTELGASPDVLAISFHVDYWDYLGWKDAWSSPEWSARQRRMARAFGDNRVYTPQLVVNGKTGFVGSSRSKAERAIASAKGAPRIATRVAVAAAKEGGWTVTADVVPAGSRRALLVEALLLESERVTDVTAGENAGRTMRNDGIVRRVVEVGEIAAGHTAAWTRTAHLPSPSGPAGPRRIAVLVRDAGTLEILGAAVQPAGD